MRAVSEEVAELFSAKYSIPGWCPESKAQELAKIVVARQPKLCAEVGVFGGKSLFPMALACRANGGGRVIGIDPWNPLASQEGYSGINAEWWGKLDHEGIYQSFLANLQLLGLGQWVEVRRMKSEEFKPTQPLDLLHLDGQHTEAAVREIRRFTPHVPLGGVVILDDLGWQNDGQFPIAEAVKLLLTLGFRELSRTKLPTGEEWGVFEKVNEPDCI